MSAMSLLAAVCIAVPAVRNKSDLNAAWVTSWAAAATIDPAPIPTNMNPY
jgi:hypothetical protein